MNDEPITDEPTTDEKPTQCSICGCEIQKHPLSGWAHGNNAQPLNDGRCCDECDNTIVIPSRIVLLRRRQGDFPRGQKYPDDEGAFELRIAADKEQGVVRIDFGKPIRWMAFEPPHALELADLITRKARQIAEK